VRHVGAGARPCGAARRVVVAAALVAASLAPVVVAVGGVGATAPVGPALTVNATAGVHPISPLIYGMNSYQVDQTLATELKVPVERWGGDATSRYNWQQDSSNSGGDWYFMGGNGQATPTPSASADALVDKDRASGGQTIMTVPIIPWINKTSATNCSFPTSVYGPQQSVNPYVTLPGGGQCGNGLTPGGTTITDTDVAANNTPNSPAFEAGWVQHFVTTYGTAANGGVGIYQMDNEPSGWNNTHRDIHPAHTGWDELVGLTEQYAAAVKGVDPSAAVDGPGDFGWAAYVDAGAPGDNRASHGGSIWEAQYYLQQLAAYQAAHGVRLLDYFDEHYYPTTPAGVSCIALCPAGDAATQAARLAATRSLWDPTYVENDWIGQWYGDIDLIPRMKHWVTTFYPGTKVAITEYNFGGVESMNGALAEADVLGIFGAQGLDMATMWGPPTSLQPAAYSFRMYRNYDGAGDGFGDTSVQAQSADQSQLSVYAATRRSDGALTVMVLNKTATPLSSTLSLSGFAPAGTAKVYTYDAQDPTAIVEQPDQPMSASGATVTYPADSITLLVVPPAPPAVTPPPRPPPVAPSTPPGHGYWEVGADGGIFTFGSAQFHGSTGSMVLQRGVVGITPTADRAGYWLVASDGGLFSFGDAGFFGSIPGLGVAPPGTPGAPRRLSAPIVGMVPSADGGGYFMVGSDGGVFAFGDARYEGSCPGIGGCDGPAVSVQPDGTGRGYWLVTATGSVYAFGDAPYLGAPAPQSVPVTAAVRTPDGQGYWLLFANGVVAGYGDARDLGSATGQTGPLDPATAIVSTADGQGYWITTAAGGAYPFGDAPSDGSMAGQHLNAPVIAASGW